MSSFKDWSKEKWNGGCPVNVMVPGAVINYGDCLREPFHRWEEAGKDGIKQLRPFSKMAAENSNRSILKMYTSTRKNTFT